MKADAVILASGFSRRFGENKLLLNLGGKPLFSHILEL
ncbi:MAG: NTP transferase domain-containing protein [Firmicutes bacterium]|nr:NTP transferase domain-containing protein [Bacillota bacterium]